jgi:hypothetical protein
VLFICGSLNQTTQMHAVATELAECRAAFTPYYGDGYVELWRRLGLIEFSIGGNKLRERCVRYLDQKGLRIDTHGERGRYDLVVTCSDVVVPRNVRGTPLVAVQEGILDPEGIGYRLVRALPFLPLWMAGTAATGQSGAFERFCVASAGYREHFIARGVAGEKIVVTGIPNFDDCERYRTNDFPHHGYVLVCTSDARETMKGDDRDAFLRRALEIAGGRQLVFKLHPNERRARAIAEIRRLAPGALVMTGGSAEGMVANADVVICQYSTLAFVALALGKEVHSHFPRADLERLLPEQNRSAARRIADVCRQVLRSRGAWTATGARAPLESAA